MLGRPTCDERLYLKRDVGKGQLRAKLSHQCMQWGGVSF